MHFCHFRTLQRSDAIDLAWVLLWQLQGPGTGSSAANFMALLLQPNLPKGLIALADQDDVWLPDKLSRAVEYLAKAGPNLPAIYASESILTDENLRPLTRFSDPRPKPGFRNALVQNLFSGHSTVLNEAAMALVQLAGLPRTIAFHDWWLYQLVAGAGGECLLDPAQTVLYRQHGNNAFGAAHGVRGLLLRLKHLLRNKYGNWLRGHWTALHDVSAILTPDARDLVGDLVSNPRAESRTTQFRRLGLFRGTAVGTLALLLAARLGRV